MGVFIDTLSNCFVNIVPLIDTPQLLLDANDYGATIIVESVTITNKGRQDIRITLQKIRTTSGEIDLTALYQNEVPAFSSCNIIANIPLKLNYDNTITPTLSDKLECYANGYTQVFDCDINYVVLKETAIPTLG